MTNYEEEYPQWNDWHWQMRNRVFNAQQLSKWIPVSDELRSEIESCTVRFRMAATPYFLSLIDPDDPDDPIRKQCMLAFSPALQMSVGVLVILLTGWWILALGIIRIVHAFHLRKIKREADGFGFGEMLGSNWLIALILGILLTIFGFIVILNPMMGLGMIGVLIGCGVITAGVNLIYLGCSPWIL